MHHYIMRYWRQNILSALDFYTLLTYIHVKNYYWKSNLITKMQQGSGKKRIGGCADLRMLRQDKGGD